MLGYLVAFSLGIFCATCIYMGLQKGVQQPAPTVHDGTREFEPQVSAPPVRRAPDRTPVSVPPAPTVLSEESEPPEAQQPAGSAAKEQEFAQVPQPPRPQVTASAVQPVIPISVAPRTRMTRVGGRISGTVRLQGIPPAERPLPLDPACGAVFQGPKTTRFYRVG